VFSRIFRFTLHRVCNDKVLISLPEVLLIVGPLLGALDGDAEDGVAAGGVGIHVGGPHASVLVTWPAHSG